MKKRSKNQKQKMSTTVAKRKAQEKKYESHYLAIALIAFLLLEGCLFSITQTADWQKGMAVLDISGSVATTTSDMAVLFQPIASTFDDVNLFYQVAATKATPLMDLSENSPIDDVSVVAGGVSEFYRQASIQLSQLLDVSNVSSWSARVAGASTQN